MFLVKTHVDTPIGTISVNSKLGDGTMFDIELPVGCASN